MGIIQFTLKSLSRPRGPVCCCSATIAWPCNISIHPLELIRISIGGAFDSGSRSVPAPLCRSTESGNDGAGPPMFIGICATAHGDAINSKKTTRLQDTPTSEICAGESNATQCKLRTKSAIGDVRFEEREEGTEEQVHAGALRRQRALHGNQEQQTQSKQVREPAQTSRNLSQEQS